MKTNSEQEIARLCNLTESLQKYNDQYRRGEQPDISDTVFDSLIRELKELEQKYPAYATDGSPTKRIGVEPPSGHDRVRHDHPMLSIENVYTLDALAEYLTKIEEMFRSAGREQPHWVIEYKIDGVALALVYEKGQLVSARTRGDGEVGEDVLANARTITDIPLDLTLNETGRVEIRGEVYMKTSAFQKFNQSSHRKYANPRNATAGAIRLLDPQKCAKRPLSFIAHSVAGTDSFPAGTQQAFFYRMEAAGIPTSRIQKEEKADTWLTGAEVLEFCRTRYEEMYETTKRLDFETDGLVIKLDEFSDRDFVGTTSSAPRWAIALKVEKYEATTVLEDVSWQVGKSGQLTPVAHLSPVQIAGTMVARSTLHNLDEIKRMGLRIGDTVRIEKAGKIIPHVLEVVRSHPTGQEITPPASCPSCGGRIEIETPPDKSTLVRCIEPGCTSQQVARILFYASRDGVEISGLGEQIIESLVEQGHVSDVADLYTLTEQTLLGLPRMGKASASKLHQAIEATKHPSLEKFLHALSIPYTGEGTSKRLAKFCQTLEMVTSLGVSQLAQIPDIGPITAEAVYQFFHTEYWKKLMQKFNKAGVSPAEVPQEKNVSQSLAGKSIVVTGTLAHYGRREIEYEIERHGGKSSGSVSRNTAFVLVGEKPGSKLAKARELGIPLLNETEFERMIGKV